MLALAFWPCSREIPRPPSNARPPHKSETPSRQGLHSPPHPNPKRQRGTTHPIPTRRVSEGQHIPSQPAASARDNTPHPNPTRQRGTTHPIPTRRVSEGPSLSSGYIYSVPAPPKLSTTIADTLLSFEGCGRERLPSRSSRGVDPSLTLRVMMGTLGFFKLSSRIATAGEGL